METMVTTIPLAVIETGDQPRGLTPLAPLSPARAALAKAHQVRANAEAEYHEASRARLVAERFVAERDRINARIAEIESINAGILDHWAASGRSDAPDVQGEVELDLLCGELTEAERLAKAASVAMPTLIARVETAQRSLSDATIAVREAVVAIVAEEMKVELDAICEEERRTATRRATIDAAIRVLDLMGARCRTPNAREAAHRLQRSIPPAIAPTDVLIRDQMLGLQRWVENLFDDEVATR
jgi:hypothetical protein